MKKQILLLTFLTLAFVFAGISNLFGQALNPGITSTQPLPPLSCTGTANFLHPIAGQPYIYEMDGSSGDETVSQWNWFATKNPSFITNGVLATDSLTVSAGDLLDASGNYGTTSGTNSVEITWSPEILANTIYQGDATANEPTFVVGYGTGVNCADNIQVYEINPIMSFVIDIANVGATGTMNWDQDTSQCVDLVQLAAYNNTSKELDMDYGQDTLYFEIAAANFVTSWSPTFTLLGGLTDPQTAELGLATSLADAEAGTFISGGTTSWDATNIGVGNGWTTGLTLTANNAGDVATGVSVFLRVIISNNTYESLTAQTFSLAVDATDGTGQWDMEDEDCDPATIDDSADQVDFANHIIDPRPTIEDANVPDSNPVEPNYRIQKTGGTPIN